jgi:hypothetical protein
MSALDEGIAGAGLRLVRSQARMFSNERDGLLQHELAIFLAEHADQPRHDS